MYSAHAGVAAFPDRQEMEQLGTRVGAICHVRMPVNGNVPRGTANDNHTPLRSLLEERFLCGLEGCENLRG